MLATGPGADAVRARVRTARRDGAAARRDHLARGSLPHRLGRRAAPRRPLGRRLREQGAQQARGWRCPTASSSTRTRASATASSRSLHEIFTWMPRAAEETSPGTRFGTRQATGPRIRKSSRGDVVIKNKFGALAGCALLALGVAACGSSGSSSSTTHRLGRSATDDLRRGLDVRGPRLRTVGLVSVAADRQLPGRRLGRGHHRGREQDRRLRRQRPAAEARRRRSDRQERQPGGADPDVPGRDHRLLQPPRPVDRPEARRQDDRQHLPRQDQDLERRRKSRR